MLLALGLCAFGGVVTLLGRLASGPLVEQKRVQLTSEAGAQAYPSFSPDGKQVAYSAHTGSHDEEGFHIMVRTVVQGSPRQLTSGAADDVGPVWSPDGTMLAFLRVQDGRAQVMTIPPAGGTERKVAEFDAAGDDAAPVPSLDWMRDGRALVAVVGGEKKVPALSIVSVQDGTMRSLTHPPEGSLGDSTPAVSPDGKSLAFVRNQEDERADIYLCDLNGGSLRQLTFDNHAIRGLAWAAGGTDLVYSSDRGSGWRLWRLPSYGGSPRDLLVAGNRSSFPAVSAKVHLLAFTDSPSVSAVYRAQLGTADGPSGERQVIHSTARESNAAWSPDGTKIANVSEMSGTPEIWISDANGGNRVQLTKLEGARVRNPRWTPDGRTILFESRGQRGVEIYTVPAEGGKVTRILADAGDASWSRDGKSVLYSANGQVWRAAPDGSNAKVLTHRFGSGEPEESVDGKWVYYRARRTIWRVPVEGGKEDEYFVPEHDLLWGGSLHPVKDGIYYSEFERGQRAVAIAFYDFATGKSRPVLRVKNGDLNEGFSLSPDGKWVLYAKTDRSQTNLVLVENFR